MNKESTKVAKHDAYESSASADRRRLGSAPTLTPHELAEPAASTAVEGEGPVIRRMGFSLSTFLRR